MPRRDRGLSVPPLDLGLEATEEADSGEAPTSSAAASEPAVVPVKRVAAPRKRAAAKTTQATKPAAVAELEPAGERLYDALISNGGRAKHVLMARGLEPLASQGVKPLNVALPIELATAINTVTNRETNPKRDLIIALLYAYCQDMGILPERVRS